MGAREREKERSYQGEGKLRGEAVKGRRRHSYVPILAFQRE